QCWLRKVSNLLKAFIAIVKDELRHSMILARNLATHADCLDSGVTLESILSQRAAKLSLFGREGTDNPVHLNRCEIAGRPGNRWLIASLRRRVTFYLLQWSSKTEQRRRSFSYCWNLSY